MAKKRTKIIIAIGIITLLLAGLLAVYVYRNVQEKPPVMVEQSTNAAPVGVSDEVTSPVKTLSGTFTGVDAIHSGAGSLQVTEVEGKAVLTFSDDFTVTQGPDLFVYLSPNAPGEDLGEYVSLGNLKAEKGSQTYDLPANYKDYKTVIVWCRAFGVTFATAELLAS